MVSIGSSIFVSREEIFSHSDTNSATTSGSGSGLSSTYSFDFESSTTSTALLSRIFIMPTIRILKVGFRGVEHTKYEEVIIRPTNLDS